jgi:hypothetical protein
MQRILASPSTMPMLLRGKYSRWAEGMDVETLEAALVVVGEFGSRYWAMRSSGGRLPAPAFERHSMAEHRMVYALESFAMVRASGQLDFQMDSGWNLRFSSAAPAFVPVHERQLAHDPRTAWARMLDERSFAVVLWMIGEYGTRVNSSRGPNGGAFPPPTFDGPTRQTAPMRAALKLVAMLEAGARVTRGEADHIIASGAF